ncbi:MFS general substrate transporter [Annulohypoxylon truncatum]|uniref:MFS general substrate transporter n=1 Tax=Annulohypoxylon truncatum TaxID=327061 RepID=UPI0020080A6B|nr:MFS general substrate transporter [Annulohypoxylon truncatum]KAI1212099.1 MFS general substrate transporter [Annulohypoxylon truncatum]
MPFKSLRELDTSEGTVQLYNGNLSQQHLEGGDTVLFPQPSSDPNDPLRWPKWRKHVVFLSICLFSCLNNFSGTVLSDSFLPIAEDLHVSIDDASGLISWVILTQGISNLFWVPTAIYLGKRPVFIVSCAICFIGAIWAAASPNYGSLLGGCIFGAFGGGASEALGAAIVNDIYFLHERGTKMSWYIVFIAFGSSLGPLCGGYLIEYKGWAWGKWLSAILLGVNLLLIILFAPETRFRRSPNLVERSDSSAISESTSEKVEGDKYEHLEVGGRSLPSSQPSSTFHRKTYLQSLNPWSGIARDTSYLSLILRPIPLLAYPACFFATLTYSLALAPTVMVNTVSSTILIPPPYNFSIGAVGLINIPGMIGQGIGAFIGGLCIDKGAAYCARRNNGVFVPETRLFLFLIPTIVVFTGIVLFGFSVEQQMSWPVIFTAYGLMSVGLTGSASITMTYVCDCYFPVSAECLEMINGIKNIVAFGLVHGVVPWVDNMGYAKAFGTLGGIFGGLMALVVPLLVWGPQIRHHTSSKWRLVSWELE